MTTESHITGSISATRPIRLLDLKAKDLWSSDCPKPLRQASWSEESLETTWDAWRKHLATRSKTPSLVALSRAKTPPVHWGAGSPGDSLDWLSDYCVSATKATNPALQEDALQWAEESTTREVDPTFALECLAWAYALPGHAQRLSADAWWSLTDALYAVIEEAEFANFAVSSDDPEFGMTSQLLAGELPLVLSCLLPEIKPLRELRKPARDTLSDALVDWTDGEGLLHGRLLGIAAPLFACWTRCRVLGEDLSKGAWNSSADTQYEWLIRQNLRLVDRDGIFPLTKAEPQAMNEVFQSALHLAGDESDDAAAKLRLRRTKVEETDADAPEPSNQSDWSGLAVLGAGWRDKAPRLVVSHHEDQLEFELRSAGKVLFSGPWPIDISAGKALRAEGDWECSCWYSDEDCDFMEVEIELEQGMRLERQFLLARQDGVAMLSELLYSDSEKSHPLNIRSSYPLGKDLTFTPQEETREGLLVRDQKPVAGIIPLALPEWRTERRLGELTLEADNQLLLQAETQARNLASPLWIDLSPTRFSKQCTWRQLTVAESLKQVAPEVAVGYRVQAGKQQWMIYRSLDPPANRTILGQNLASEALIGRFLSTGEVDEYLEIEADDD